LREVFYACFFSIACIKVACAQDTTAEKSQNSIIQEDPTKFFTRVELFNELQRHRNDVFLNATTVRTVIQLGKRFTTRLDVPLVYNSKSVADYRQYGFGDISLRLVGFRFAQTKKAALAASVEFSFNTAMSPLLGTGKNVIIPTLFYTQIFRERRIIAALAFQQFNSLWGDESRQKINFSRFQAFFVKGWTKRIWMLLLPELYIDYENPGASMTMEATMFYRLTGHVTLWAKGGAGLFGDHVARYLWTTEAGIRYALVERPGVGRKKK